MRAPKPTAWEWAKEITGAICFFIFLAAFLFAMCAL